MIDELKHECGIVLIKLRKPLQYYLDTYSDKLKYLDILYLMLQKQINRGQEGAGIAVVKNDVPPGVQYLNRERKIGSEGLRDCFDSIHKRIPETINQKLEQQGLKNEDIDKNGAWLSKYAPFIGETLIGHLRYGTHGNNELTSCHPIVKESRWRSKALTIAGNFNLTNADDIFNQLIKYGQHPRQKVDTVIVSEKIAYFLDKENKRVFNERPSSIQDDRDKTVEYVEKNINLFGVLEEASLDFDGGYVIVGSTGYGTAFVLRDPNGIRPAYYYEDEEVVVVSSERPPIKTALGIEMKDIQEVPRGYAITIDKHGEIEIEQVLSPAEPKSCTFERIYFSRASDYQIYEERKKLGAMLAPRVLKSINDDLKNTIFSYIPRSSRPAFNGLIEAIQSSKDQKIKDELGKTSPNMCLIHKLLDTKVRSETLVTKDLKQRTFISDFQQRANTNQHIYDLTYDSIGKNDTLVLIDDSIVRGATLAERIVKRLVSLKPKRIIMLSSAPQIKYPDCYGIDMASYGELIAFQAAVKIHEDRGDYRKLKEEIYQNIKSGSDEKNYVLDFYKDIDDEELSKKIGEIILKKAGHHLNMEIIYQTVEDLHKSCPNHHGDWYFSGDYPTKGGIAAANRGFKNYCEGNTKRRSY